MLSRVAAQLTHVLSRFAASGMRVEAPGGTRRGALSPGTRLHLSEFAVIRYLKKDRPVYSLRKIAARLASLPRAGAFRGEYSSILFKSYAPPQSDRNSIPRALPRISALALRAEIVSAADGGRAVHNCTDGSPVPPSFLRTKDSRLDGTRDRVCSTVALTIASHSPLVHSHDSCPESQI